MKLSQLLAGLEKIQGLQKQQTHTQVWQLCKAELESAVKSDAETFGLIPQINLAANHLQQSMDDFALSLTQSYDILQRACDDMATEYHHRGEDIYRKNMERIGSIIKDPEKSIREVWDRGAVMLPDELDLLQGRLDAFNDWRLPGMIIGPGLGDWIDRLVALDPLYLVDVDVSLLHPCMQKFPLLYQQRLRKYAVDETQPTVLNRLPQAQIGIACAYDVFFIKPPRIIANYIKGVWECLRSGGLFLFNYSNGDHSHAAESVERGVHCYTPATIIREICQAQGFVTEFEYQSDLGWNYVEVRKPGIMTSLRGGQSLAKIHTIL